MTRLAYYECIEKAHDALHAGDIAAAHEALHSGLVPPGSMTCDPEVQSAVKGFLEFQEGKLGCGHTIGDLVSGGGMITQCGACRAAQLDTKLAEVTSRIAANGGCHCPCDHTASEHRAFDRGVAMGELHGRSAANPYDSKTEPGEFNAWETGASTGVFNSDH